MSHSTTGLSDFLALFNFQPELRFHLGVEMEYLLMRNGQPVPAAEQVLAKLGHTSFTYELSACQIEHRTKPVHTPRMAEEACVIGREQLRTTVQCMGLSLRTLAVAPASMPLDTYSDARYAEIARLLGRDKLLAACRVMGTHIHVGVGNAREAVLVYNALVAAVPTLSALCGPRNNQRLGLYRTVQPCCDPPTYASLRAWYLQAQQDGFAVNPRNCWHLVRISRHGTVEVRLFPATGNSRNIRRWAAVVQQIARAAVG